MFEERTQFDLLHNHDGINSQRIKGNNLELKTTAKKGFLLIPRCAGTPTGVAEIGSMVYDYTNNKLYIYITSWKQVQLT